MCEKLLIQAMKLIQVMGLLMRSGNEIVSDVGIVLLAITGLSTHILLRVRH